MMDDLNDLPEFIVGIDFGQTYTGIPVVIRLKHKPLLINIGRSRLD
jgi:hypothetical protein